MLEALVLKAYGLVTMDNGLIRKINLLVSPIRANAPIVELVCAAAATPSYAHTAQWTKRPPIA